MSALALNFKGDAQKLNDLRKLDIERRIAERALCAKKYVWDVVQHKNDFAKFGFRCPLTVESKEADWRHRTCFANIVLSHLSMIEFADAENRAKNPLLFGSTSKVFCFSQICERTELIDVHYKSETDDGAFLLDELTIDVAFYHRGLRIKITQSAIYVYKHHFCLLKKFPCINIRFDTRHNRKLIERYESIFFIKIDSAGYIFVVDLSNYVAQQRVLELALIFHKKLPYYWILDILWFLPVVQQANVDYILKVSRKAYESIQRFEKTKHFD